MSGSKPSRVRVGTRASDLAVIQTGLVVSLLREAHPDIEFALVRISTAGDRDKRSALEAVGVSIFVRELEAALEDGRADIAIHSLKDMPSELPKGFTLAALPERGDPRDVLISRFGGGVTGLPPGARIGTSSPRRATQLRTVRPDIEILPIRGNVNTRMTKALGGDETGYDGAIIAAAGLDRMGRLSEVSEILNPNDFVPASGQGTLAVETLTSNTALTEIVSAVDHAPTRAVSSAERAFLARLGAGCATATAAYATLDGDQMALRCFAASPTGHRSMTQTHSGDVAEAASIGSALADDMIKNGALELIRG
ncbi:MAG: hydroxymethylbilane synthase [Dehalococcoidia bacterium]|nr:hydroxymethylbilane synthase [Dehalococcoidia bacterium]